MSRKPLLLLVALALLSCGDDDTEPGSTGAPTDTAAPQTATLPSSGSTTAPDTGGQSTAPDTGGPSTASTLAPRPQVGTVLDIVSPGGTVDGHTAEEDTAILAAGVLKTAPAGKIRFGVAGKFEECILRSQGLAVVVPGDGSALDVQRGEASCWQDGTEKVFMIVSGVPLEVAAHDGSAPAVFDVFAEGGSLQVVRVASGEIRVGGVDVRGGEEVNLQPDGGLVRQPITGLGDDLRNIVSRAGTATVAPPRTTSTSSTTVPGTTTTTTTTAAATTTTTTAPS